MTGQMRFAQVPEPRQPMRVVPLTQHQAKAWVDEHHRHLSAPRGDVVRVGVARGGALVGVAHAGRPKARMLNDGQTLEITRVATDGTRNACSFAYGALRRAGRALGWTRFITYTLLTEPGTSLRAAGWAWAGQTQSADWDRPSRARGKPEVDEPKNRWVWPPDEWTDELERWLPKEEGHEQVA